MVGVKRKGGRGVLEHLFTTETPQASTLVVNSSIIYYFIYLTWNKGEI